MAIIRLTIRGMIYQLFPKYDKTNPNCDSAGAKLVRKERLEELDRERPELILMPEPENMNDPMAIRVYAKGASVGYVAHEETHEAYRLFDASQSMARARFVQIDTTRNGDFIAEAELPVEALIKPQPKPVRTEAWKDWKCTFPKLSMPLAWKECHVLEYQMEELFAHPDERNIKLLKDYMKVWTDKSLHDFSVDAMQLRKRYIGQLRTLGLEQSAQRLERQYAAISSAHRMTYRMKWWKELQQTDEMELYWNAWRSGRMDDNLWSDLHQVDSQLRHMPDGLYSQIADLTCLFSAMRYRDNVSRPVLWEVYTLLLLRERICRELGIAMKPMPVHAYGVEEKKEDVHVSPLTDARLAKAVEDGGLFCPFTEAQQKDSGIKMHPDVVLGMMHAMRSKYVQKIDWLSFYCVLLRRRWVDDNLSAWCRMVESFFGLTLDNHTLSRVLKKDGPDYTAWTDADERIVRRKQLAAEFDNRLTAYFEQKRAKVLESVRAKPLP